MPGLKLCYCFVASQFVFPLLISSVIVLVGHDAQDIDLAFSITDERDQAKLVSPDVKDADRLPALRSRLIRLSERRSHVGKVSPRRALRDPVPLPQRLQCGRPSLRKLSQCPPSDDPHEFQF